MRSRIKSLWASTKKGMIPKKTNMPISIFIFGWFDIIEGLVRILSLGHYQVGLRLQMLLDEDMNDLEEWEEKRNNKF